MKCPNCNEGMRARGYKHVTKVGGFTVEDGTGMVPSCVCGEVLLSAEALAGYERRAARQILTEGKKVGGDVLKFARKALGLRQKDLAALLRCNEQQVSRWEKDDELAMDLRLAVAMLLDIAEKPELGTVDDVGASPVSKLEIRKAS